MIRKEKGITLIALIITIIILVILAAVSIRAAYNSGIIDYSINGTKKYQEEEKKEQSVLSETEEKLKSLINKIEEPDEEEDQKDYGDDWIIAWVSDGENWSNPYSREEGLIEDYFPDMDDDYSINSVEEIDSAPVKALLYENSGNTGYTLVLSGNDEIPSPEYVCQPWIGKYWGTSEELTSYDFMDDFSNNIKRIEIRNGITAIGIGAFRGMQMEYVSIPGSVEYIGGEAFGYCGSYLTDVEFASDFHGEFGTYDGVSYAFFFTDWIYSLVDEGLATYTNYPSRVDVNYTINGTPWIFVWVVD